MGTGLPPTNAFSVTAGGNAVALQLASTGGVGVTDAIRLFVADSATIYTGQTVVVTYTDPSASDDTAAAQDTAGNDAASFTTGTSGVPAVTNDSTVTNPDTPTIDDVDVTSTPVLETDTYGAGEKIRLTVEFSKAVTVTGAPHIEFSLGNQSDTRRVEAVYESGSGTDSLVFAYTVVSSDEDNNGIFTHADVLMVESGESIVSAGGTNADLDHSGDGTASDHKVDGSRSIVSVAVSSTPMLETDTYGAGETIRFKVTFNVPVDVTGDPVLTFVLGNSGDVREVDAAYEMGGGSTALVFGYTVVSTDEDNNGIDLRDEQDYDSPDGPVRLDSNDEIEFKDTSTDVPLYWQGRGNHPNHKVDGSRTTGNAEMTTTCTLNTGDLWCGVVTVEPFVISPLPLYGFGQGEGDLSDMEFTYGSNSYTIDVAANELNNELLYFSLTSALTAGDRAALELHVDGNSASFAFSAANYSSSSHNYIWTGTGLDWFGTSTVTLRLREAPNNAPAFSPTSTTRTVAENSAAGTNVGAVIPEAMDADSGDTLTYSMEGTDAASFAFDASSRQITTIAGVDYNFEATQNTYEVTVKASDGTDSGELAVTISLTDAAEKSAKPDKPTLAAVPGSSTSLTASWRKPDLDGGPDIAFYALQYDEPPTNTWIGITDQTTETMMTITGLMANTEYRVRVRASNREQLSDWSDASDAVRTNAVDIPIPPGLVVTLHLSDEDGSVLENARMGHGDGDGVARLARALHGDGVGGPGGAGDRGRLQAEHEPGAELRRERDREHRGGEYQAGLRRRPRAARRRDGVRRRVERGHPGPRQRDVDHHQRRCGRSSGHRDRRAGGRGRGRGDGGRDRHAHDPAEHRPGDRRESVLSAAAGNGHARQRLHPAVQSSQPFRHRSGLGVLSQCRRHGLRGTACLHARHR